MHIIIIQVIIFGKLNGISTPRRPLGFYNYPYTNSFVNDYPEVSFADSQMVEFCRLYPDNTNYIREKIIYDFFNYIYYYFFFGISWHRYYTYKCIRRQSIEGLQ